MARRPLPKIDPALGEHLAFMPIWVIPPEFENDNEEKCARSAFDHVCLRWKYGLAYFLNKTCEAKFAYPDVGDDIKKCGGASGSLLVSMYDLLIQLHPLWRGAIEEPHKYQDAGDWFAGCFKDLYSTEMGRIFSGSANAPELETLSTRRKIHAVEKTILTQLEKGQNPYEAYLFATSLRYLVRVYHSSLTITSGKKLTNLWNKFLENYGNHVQTFYNDPNFVQCNYASKLGVQYHKEFGKTTSEKETIL